MDNKNPKYLRKRGDQWFVRMIVKPKLQSIIGKTQLWRKVGNTRAEALRNCHGVIFEFQKRLIDAEADFIAAIPPAHKTRADFYDEQLNRLLQLKTLHHAEAASSRKQESKDAAETVYNKDLQTRNMVLNKIVTRTAEPGLADALFGYLIDDRIEKGFLDKDVSEDQRNQIYEQYARLELIAADKVQKQNPYEDVFERPKHVLLDAEATVKKSNKKVAGITLQKVLSSFSSAGSLSPKTLDDHHYAIKIFHEIAGYSLSVTEITPEHMRSFRDTLAQLPSNASKKFPSLSVPEAIKANEQLANPHAKLGLRTLKKYFTIIQKLLTQAMNDELLAAHPAPNMRIAGKVNQAISNRKNFTKPDLNEIFDHELFSNTEIWGERQWGILIAAYTGARTQSEIAKLRTTNFYNINGIEVVHFAEGSKNKNADHIVPIHNRLLELGLLDFVKKAKSNRDQRIFPHWHETKFVNRWFNERFMKQVGIDHPQKCMHSFRHTLKTEMNNLGIPRAIADKIVPHEDKSAASGYIHTEAADIITEMQTQLSRVNFERIERM